MNESNAGSLRSFCLFILTLLVSLNTHVLAQGIAISDDSTASAHNSAILDVEVTGTSKKGVLIPRMTASQRGAITSPATGLLVYQTNSPQGFYYFDGSGWLQLSGSTVSTAANAGEVALRSTGGALVTDTGLVYTSQERLGIGYSQPEAALHVESDDGILARGTYSSTATAPSYGAGTRLQWIPTKGAFRAGVAASNDWDGASVGEYSISLGRHTTASGYSSIAFGDNTEASGVSSTAFGLNTTASGYRSTTMGEGTSATGFMSTAIGYRTNANSYSSTSLGQYNIGGGTPSTFNAQDPIFEIGNGTSSSAKSNAFTVLKDARTGVGTRYPSTALNVIGSVIATDTISATTFIGDGSNITGLSLSETDPEVAVTDTGKIGRWNGTALSNGSIHDAGTHIGIGTTTPEFRLSLVGDGGILAKGAYGSGSSLSTSGSGTRMIWYPRKAAFRAGHVASTQWDNIYIGDYSMALGYSPKAAGQHSLAIGYEAEANHNYTTALGRRAKANGQYSVALGASSTAGGEYSLALGFLTSATAQYSTAIGRSTTASATYATALGSSTIASGQYSTAFGASTTASGSSSTAMGNNTKANALYGTAMGSYNIGGGAPTSLTATDPILEVGNGPNSTSRSNALTILRNANTGIGTRYPSTALNVIGSLIATDTISATTFLGDGSGLTGISLTESDPEVSSSDTGMVGTWNGTTLVDGSVYDGGGHVGIGTTAPEFTLSLESDGGILAKGVYGSGSTLSTIGAGTRLIWYPRKAAFRAGTASAAGWSNANIGDYSTAFGYSTIASGSNSFAGGSASVASGDGSFAAGLGTSATGFPSVALGYYTSATGGGAVALGRNTTANGVASIAMGESTNSDAYCATALGLFNIGGGSATTSVNDDPVFEIGNGSSSSKSNALTVLKNARTGIGTRYPSTALNVIGSVIATDTISATTFLGDGSGLTGISLTESDPEVSSSGTGRLAKWNGTTLVDATVYEGSGRVGINTTSPELMLSLDTDGGILAKGSYGSGTTLTTSGGGTRMIWYPRKAAFRAGRVTTTEWNELNIGPYSSAMGYNTKAKGDHSTALGYSTIASGNSSLASGYLTEATTSFATAMGYDTKASGAYSTALGRLSTASGESSVAMGHYSYAIGGISFAMGYIARAQGINSVAMGDQTTASGSTSVAMGYKSNATNTYSTAMGNQADATGYNSTAMGHFTDATGQYSTAMGSQSTAGGTYATAMGRNTSATVEAATAMGNGSTASGLASTAMGRSTTAYGQNSTALGNTTNSDAYCATALGLFNIGGGSATTSVSDDPVFEIGNGASTSAKSNAMTVLKDARTGIGTRHPSTDLNVIGSVIATDTISASEFKVSGNSTLGVTVPQADNTHDLGSSTARWANVHAANGTIQTSDRRLKDNIEELDYGLADLMRLRPVSFTWKDNPDSELHLGLIAQELQTVIPEVVHESNAPEKRLGVYYTQLIPVLLKAIQEQQQLIERQRGEIKETTLALEHRIEQMESNQRRLLQVIDRLERSEPDVRQVSATKPAQM